MDLFQYIIAQNNGSDPELFMEMVHGYMYVIQF